MDPLFDSQKLNALGLEHVALVRSAFDRLLLEVRPCLDGSGRYEALVKTQLEASCMVAVKGIAVQPRYQDK